jgi:hypothetical protein
LFLKVLNQRVGADRFAITRQELRVKHSGVLRVTPAPYPSSPSGSRRLRSENRIAPKRFKGQ